MNKLKNGNVYSIGQTVNGVNIFLWFNDKWYYFIKGLTREYEYDQEDLTELIQIDEFEEVEYLGNILDNFNYE
jgi:hypothetical protein